METNNWISVKDKLPRKGQIVLTYRPKAKESGDDVITIQQFISRDSKNVSPQGVVHGFDRWCHPSHWMPLPKSPKKLKNDNRSNKTTVKSLTKE